MYDRLEFVTLLQTLEAFHRSLGSKQFLSKRSYERIKLRLIDAIPDDVEDDHRQSLESKIEYGYEYSQRKRIRELIDSLPEWLRTSLAKKVPSFLGRIIDTRNYYTHYDNSAKDGIMTEREVAIVNRALRVLLRFLLLRHIGVPQELIKPGLMDCWDFKEYVHYKTW